MPDERYEDFLGPLPQFGPDTRQDAFRQAAGSAVGPKSILMDTRLGKVEIANIGRGWPATKPDLGFLQNGMKRLIELKKLDCKSKKQVHQFLDWAVQRVIRVTLSEDPGEVQVCFWTKDDHGIYTYGFGVGI